MTPEELAAQAAAAAAANPAPAAGGATPPPATQTPNPADPSGELDLDKLDEKTREYIKSLRKESGKYRTEAKDAKAKLKSVETAIGAVGEETPEAKAARVAAEREQVIFDNAVLNNAIEFGVPKESMKYFKYLIAEAAQSLGDSEELSAEKIAEFAKEAKAKSVKVPASTTVTAPGAATPAPASGDPALTAEQFAKLGFNDKCKLYEKNAQQYEQLMAAAVAKGLIK